jgi:hypothetical protein
MRALRNRGKGWWKYAKKYRLFRRLSCLPSMADYREDRSMLPVKWHVAEREQTAVGHTRRRLRRHSGVSDTRMAPYQKSSLYLEFQCCSAPDVVQGRDSSLFSMLLDDLNRFLGPRILDALVF